MAIPAPIQPVLRLVPRSRHFGMPLVRQAVPLTALHARSQRRAQTMIVRPSSAIHRVYACGNGGSASDAEHLVAELVGRLEQERPGLRQP